MKILRALDALSDRVVKVDAEQRLGDVLNEVQERHATHAAVCEGGRFSGLVRLQDILLSSPLRIFADLLPKPPLPTIFPVTPIDEVGHLLAAHGAEALPVVSEEGMLLGIVTQLSLVDALLTERKSVDEALRRSETKLRRLVESNILGIATGNLDGRISDANDEFLRMLGCSPAELAAGELRWNMMGSTDEERVDEKAIDEIRKSGMWSAEREHLHPDGRCVPLLFGVSLLDYDSGECICFAIDLSERKRAEDTVRDLNIRLEQASRLSAIGSIAAGIAHELHQPLAVIVNYASGSAIRLQQGEINSEELLTSIHEITSEAMRAGKIIGGIRDFVRQREPERQLVDINGVVKDAIRLAAFNMRHGNVGVELMLADGLPKVLADAVQLTQVVLNLVLNGIEAMEESEPEERKLTLWTRRAGNDSVEVVILDTGRGIAPELQQRIFDQFFTTRRNGLGMGLAISRSIIESHGGELSVTSAPGEGSLFRFNLATADRE